MDLGVDTFTHELLGGVALDFDFIEEPQPKHDYPSNEMLEILNRHLAAFAEWKD